MKKNILYLLMLGCVLSCSDDNFGGTDCNELYFSSFENAEDFDTFLGDAFDKAAEAPADAGDNSLVVCGGCTLPHLYFDIGPFNSNKEISVQFVAKTDNGGTVSIGSINGLSDSVSIGIEGTEWTQYKTEEHLLLKANEILRVDVVSGGFIGSTTLIDLLSICDETGVE